MTVVNPFSGIRAKLVGPYSRNQSALAYRSAIRDASRWRSYAKQFRTGALRAGALYGLAAEGLRTAGGIAKRLVKRIKGAVSRKSQSQFKQIDMVDPRYSRKRRYPSHGLHPGRGQRNVKRQRIGDPASYKQLTSVKRKYGRKLRALTRNMRLLKTVTEPVRYRFGRVQDVNATVGSYWLTNQPISAGQRCFPLYIMPLHNVRQGAAVDNTGGAGRAMYELCNDLSGFFFRVTNGTDPTNTVGTTNSMRIVSPSINSTDPIGRKALFDWSRIRLCFWGKTKNPSNIRVSLVKFLDEELCPEFYDTKGAGLTTNYCTSKAAEVWTQKLKYLLNGHMGAYGRFDRKKYIRVIKEWRIDMNPIDAGAETSNSDDRGHMKHLDIFNRWNRVMDYTDRNAVNPQSYADLTNVNRASSPNDAYLGYLKDPEKGIYLMVESVQPVEEGTPDPANPRPAPATGGTLAVSFDYLLETNYTIIKE